MEIYNEKIKDLLNSENTSPEIIEDKKGVYVRNLKEVIVKTAEEVLNCIKDGEGNRHISATDYNERSSRSHTIFQIVIESRSKGLVTNANRGVRVSQLVPFFFRYCHKDKKKIVTNLNSIEFN